MVVGSVEAERATGSCFCGRDCGASLVVEAVRLNARQNVEEGELVVVVVVVVATLDAKHASTADTALRWWRFRRGSLAVGVVVVAVGLSRAAALVGRHLKNARLGGRDGGARTSLRRQRHLARLRRRVERVYRAALGQPSSQLFPHRQYSINHIFNFALFQGKYVIIFNYIFERFGRPWSYYHE